jgi:hypothetical protein
MTPAEFELAIPAGEWLRTHALCLTLETKIKFSKHFSVKINIQISSQVMEYISVTKSSDIYDWASCVVL